MKEYFVYITASFLHVLYVGMTNDLRRRTIEHKQHLVEGFTSKYNVDRLVYFERFSDPLLAIEREKQIKGWRRSKKIALVESVNPGWIDLAGTLAQPEEDPSHSLRMTAKSPSASNRT